MHYELQTGHRFRSTIQKPIQNHRSTLHEFAAKGLIRVVRFYHVRSIDFLMAVIASFGRISLLNTVATQTTVSTKRLGCQIKRFFWILLFCERTKVWKSIYLSSLASSNLYHCKQRNKLVDIIDLMPVTLLPFCIFLGHVYIQDNGPEYLRHKNVMCRLFQ